MEVQCGESWRCGAVRVDSGGGAVQCELTAVEVLQRFRVQVDVVNMDALPVEVRQV